jgi:peptidoglycan/LPS O-acetylase OafA/YrhL
MGLHNYFWERFWLFIAFSPHVASRSYGYPGVGGPLWSIGVEEYFYAIWAQVMKWFDKGVPIIALIVVVLCMMSHGLGRGFLHWNFDAMAIGAIGAWFYLNKPNWIEFIFSKPVQILTYIVAIDQLRVYRYYGPWFNTEVYSLVFLLIIMNVALNSKSFLKLENRFFRFMGEISYGFYVFQWMCNVICVNLYLKWGGISNPVFGGIVLLVGDFALTTLLAVISYRYLEQPFLRLRLRFSPIRSAIA